MNIVLLTHPQFFSQFSMVRFADMIARGMRARGHTVELWTAPPIVSRLPSPTQGHKWLGYVDQYLLYPGQLRRRAAQQPPDTVFVVTDQALGMWVPVIADRPHVIHCHDFLALRSALGEFPENPTSWTGRQYQKLIRNGFSQGRAFISVSEKSRSDLHRFLQCPPVLSEVVYNGLSHAFHPMSESEARASLKLAGVEIPSSGYILHVGGNPWYKNRRGVLEIYRAYVASSSQPVPLWLVGKPPSLELRALANNIPAPGRVHFLSGLTDEQVNAAYALAGVFLFPSLEEGFGWPIAEAMASGCPVITTDAAPMTEVAGNAARLITRRPFHPAQIETWVESAASILSEILQMPPGNRIDMVRRGEQNATRFNANKALDAYEDIYQRVIVGRMG